MKNSLSLPDELMMELIEAGEVSGRGFSGEVRMRLEHEKRLREFIAKVHPEAIGPTGVAAGRLTWVDDSNVREMSEKSRVATGDAAGVEFSAKSEIGLPVNVPDDLLDPGVLRYRKAGGKFDGVSELAKKIASENPGVVRASEVVNLGPVPENVSSVADQEKWVDGELKKLGKSRPETTGDAKVEMVKGFWREEFPSEAAAKIKAAEMGWSPNEYEIKPLA